MRGCTFVLLNYDIQYIYANIGLKAIYIDIITYHILYSIENRLQHNNTEADTDKGNPHPGRCLYNAAATIRDTRAEDGRPHYVCHDPTDAGKARHYGFIDRSEAERVEGKPDCVAWG